MKDDLQNFFSWLKTKFPWVKDWRYGYPGQTGTISPMMCFIPESGSWPDIRHVEISARLYVQVTKTSSLWDTLIDYADQIQAVFLETPNPAGWSLVKAETWEADTDETGAMGLLAIDLKMTL